MTGLIARIRAALHAHFLRGRRAQLQQGIDTLEACIRDDQALVAHMRRELRVIVDTLEACIRDDQALVAHMRRELRVIDARMADAGHAAPATAGAH